MPPSTTRPTYPPGVSGSSRSDRAGRNAAGLPAQGAARRCSQVRRPTDVLVVALLGLLGGALAAAVSIRNLKGSFTPYDVPVALAVLKVPLGAFTAVLGLVIIRGDFVPGLSTLDSPTQILAYALILGFAQHSFSYLLDKQAQSLLAGLPSKDAADRTPPGPPTRPTPSAELADVPRPRSDEATVTAPAP